ncbi:hypothetical protein [Anaerocolumna xylanovorans]|uniref:Alkaline and neutral invertase n=1 Tax=Anaerocolumna xylanovorans DSM 12503 TaxID=1121345 RepID=A0A1M7YGP9_9FIRM|nr:hypothetical protein [Anaerocolumna xylanovorans]SHO51773.1 hypothetical protein SAMN02745217_03325 [Anaerocolumna xylanovorans DSM 12503]
MNASAKTLDYLNTLSKSLIEGSRTKAFDSTVLYTPDGISSYDALWLRDFSYMVEYAGNHIPVQDIIQCINYSIMGRREDGWMPDRIYGNGTAAYAAGELGKPIGEANLDNTPFLVFTIYSLSKRMPREDFGNLFKEWLPFLETGLHIIPLGENGLVYNPADKPHSPYGFTDTVAKTGYLFMESLLFWRACCFMEEMLSCYTRENTVWYALHSKQIINNIDLLLDLSAGIYFAASNACRQLDIWGNAYMLYIGFPVSEERKKTVLSFLTDHYSEYVYKGQIRHLMKGEYWEQLLIRIEKEEYQNGAYWATASGWIIWCLTQTDFNLACKTLQEVVDYFKEAGAYECINIDYKKLPSFVVSATNVYGSLWRLMEKENNPGFISAYDNYNQDVL